MHKRLRVVAVLCIEFGYIICGQRIVSVSREIRRSVGIPILHCRSPSVKKDDWGCIAGPFAQLPATRRQHIQCIQACEWHCLSAPRDRSATLVVVPSPAICQCRRRSCQCPPYRSVVFIPDHLLRHPIAIRHYKLCIQGAGDRRQSPSAET